jgi:hypothetical protein
MKLRIGSCIALVLATGALRPSLFAQGSVQNQVPTVAPDKPDFGSHDIGTRTTPLAVSVRNQTGSKMKLTATLDNKREYQIEMNECGNDVSAAASCVIGISFSPTGTGERPGMLKIGYTVGADERTSKTLSVHLNGKGFLPELGISSTQICFPSQRMTTTSAPQTVTLTNNSQKELTINNIIASGDFSVEAPTSPQTLKPDGSLMAVVSFTPKQEGRTSGMLTITSSSGKSPQSVYLLGSTPDLTNGLCSASACAEISVVSVLCFLYWLAMVVVRWNRVARPTRELLRAQVTSLQAELGTLTGSQPGIGVGAVNVAGLLQAAKDLIDRSKQELGYRIANFLFWSRGQELTGWGYVHEAEIQMTQFLPDSTVTARLESAEQELRVTNDAKSLALANAIHQALTSDPPAGLSRRQALLAEALSVKYDREDNSFADLVSWQNKTSWLVGCGLVLTLVLTGAIHHHSILFLVGGTGGLLSRMSRSLERKQVPTDYGASWTTLFLSPVAGAIGAWAGILLSDLAKQVNVLGTAFAADWTEPCRPTTLAIALVFGFSERILDGVLDKLAEKTGSSQTTATNPQPPQKTTSTAPTPSSSAAPATAKANGGAKDLTIITDPKLVDGRVGEQYSVRLEASGTAGNLKWMIQQGSSLPPDLQLGQDGTIAGKPTKEGTFPFTVELADNTSKSSKAFTITIRSAA